MRILVMQRLDENFPVRIEVDGPLKFSLQEAKQLRRELDEAIEWAVNMQNLRDEERKQATAAKGEVKP